MDELENITYNSYLDEDLNREVLSEDANFINDAASFLRKRTNQEFDTAEEVYDAYLEHMRFHDTNEVTTVRDLMYAQEGDIEDKNEFARLIDVWDRMQGEDLTGQADQFLGVNWDMLGDYGEAIVRAPSTLLGILSAGGGKIAGMAAKEAAKVSTRSLLRKFVLDPTKKAAVGSAEAFGKLPGTARGAIVEGAIGAGQSVAKQETRVETGNQEELSGAQVAADALISGTIGAVPSAISDYFGRSGREKAGKLLQASNKLSEEAREKGLKNTKETLDNVADKNKVFETKDEILGEKIKEARAFVKAQEDAVKSGNPLDPKKVAEGKKLLAGLSKTEQFLANRLDDEILDTLTAAAIEVSEELGRKQGERITTTVARALSDGKISTDKLDELLDKYNLTTDQFSMIYLSELSDAGRRLQLASQQARGGSASGGKIRLVSKEQEELRKIESLANAAEEFSDIAGTVKMSAKEAKQVAEDAAKESKVFNAFQSIDRFRLSMMTGQLATTMRNNVGGGFRIAMDAIDGTFENIFKGKVVGEKVRNPFSVANYLVFNRSEAKVIRHLFEKQMPIESNKLFSVFFEGADASARTGVADALNYVGAKVNTLNRASDNLFKEAILAGRLAQHVKEATGRSMDDVIRSGDFNKIDKEVFEKAIDDAYYMVYQKAPETKFGKVLVDAHRKVPFIVSTYMPFPRFVLNQARFVAEHAPGLGLIAHKMNKGKAFSAESFAHQVTGASMFGIAVMNRQETANNGEWYHYVQEDGNKIDMRPIAGPALAYMLMADMYYRWADEGTLTKEMSSNLKDTWQALGGPQFRSGTGLATLDRLVESDFDLTDMGLSESKSYGRMMGDLVNTFTLPVATVRDFLSVSDEGKRAVPESGYVNMLDVFISQATKSLPDLSAIGIDFSITEKFSDEVDKEMGRVDPVTGEVLLRRNPLERQLFGTGTEPPSTPLQKKMVQLGLNSYDIYRPNEYAFLDRAVRQNFADDVAQELNSLSVDKNFNNLSLQQQKSELKKYSSDLWKRYRGQVVEMAKTERPDEYARYQFEALNKDVRKLLKEAYEEQYGQEIGPQDYGKAFELLPAIRQRVFKPSKL